MKHVATTSDTKNSANETLCDTKMSSGILRGLLDFIIKQDTLTQDPQFQQLKSLLSLETSPKEPQSLHLSMETVATERKVLHDPQWFAADEKYVGKNYQFLKAEAGDQVIVHAWIGETEAICFNPSNHTSGRIPTEYLDNDVPQQKVEDKTFLSGKGFKFHQNPEDIPASTPGDRIRVCERDDQFKFSGTGFNLATGQIGRFSAW